MPFAASCQTQVDDFVEAALAKFLKTGLELLKLG